MSELKKDIQIERDVSIHLENKRESRQFFWFLWVMYAVVFMTKNCYNGAMTSIVAEGILTKSQTGLMTSVFYLVYAPLQIVGGIAVDRYSPERLVKLGLVGAALANAIIFFNQNYYVMLSAWIFNAIIQFAVWPGIFKIISAQLVRSDRSAMTFYITFSSSFGMLLAYIVGALMNDWRLNFAVSSVALFGFAIGMHVFCKHLNPYMKWDISKQNSEQKTMKNTEASTYTIFRNSGFFLMIPVVLLRYMLEQGSKTMAPMMLTESYTDIPVYVGNLLNLIIIIAGIAGVLIVKMLLYPKYIRDEAVGLMVTLLIALAGSIMLRWVGVISVSQSLFGLCLLAGASSAAGLLGSYYNNSFVKYGKSGSAAGISNAASSLAAAVASYGFLRVSEISGWQAVTTLWIVMTVAAIIMVIIIIPKYKKFKEM